MTNIETQISQIGTIKEKMATHETKVISMNMRVGEMQDKIDDYDRSIHYYSQTCDDLIRSNTSLKENVENLTTKVEYLQKQQTDINIRQSNADEKLIDIQWRSMRENLIFTGISEPWDRSKVNDYCESMVREFIRDELHIDKEISFDRVHRLGRYSRYQRYPRPIVAKFTYYKDKELVRVAASQYLTGNRYRVKEQFPSKIEERRKLLYGEARSARQNRNNRVKLVRDKLYINGRQYIPGLPNNTDSSNRKTTSRQEQRNTNNNGTQNAEGQIGTRIHFDRNIDNTQQGHTGATNGQYQLQQHSTPQPLNQQRRIVTAGRKTLPHNHSNVTGASSQQGDGDFAFGANTTTSNRFSLLQNNDDRNLPWSDDEQLRESARDRQSSLVGKTKPSSPLDSSPKRQREYTSDTSHNSDNMDYEQSCDATVTDNGTNANEDFVTR